MVKTAVTTEERAAQAANEVVEVTRTGNDALFSGRPPYYPTGCSSWGHFQCRAVYGRWHRVPELVKKFDTVSIHRYHLISNIGAPHYDGVRNSGAQLTLGEPHSWLLA